MRTKRLPSQTSSGLTEKRKGENTETEGDMFRVRARASFHSRLFSLHRTFSLPFWPGLIIFLTHSSFSHSTLSSFFSFPLTLLLFIRSLSLRPFGGTVRLIMPVIGVTHTFPVCLDQIKNIVSILPTWPLLAELNGLCSVLSAAN